MGTHSVVEAKNQLSDLIDRALRGEEVVITRHGRPVARLAPIEPVVGPVTPEALDWLAAHRVGGHEPSEDSGTLLSRLRDEGEH
ncbi:type II toxin-antitoxin system prevent-host-death family antitoxin [Rhodoplanes serenus]|jgi:prevent-host-death family protein|uniref:Antitoxin n=1 Tax=Rhodoplanes serenus TaxID=200615 RepID=A0A327KEA1_9BRAD|nr:type II toxin-antitoxin system prevent-host-death family antitoxin [Rhodoplanes serenus]MBI5114475.1 type II toxin-antitoxin system prevent-host-death family antitoxin [Rhodovulum sp.]MTW19157.1 type II toxin-antitoxin system prevent-host-death family antitoxin [Rhodoplanes serenus]RAI35692.1 hypothetical protein CH340_05210 [Rhodoplanes serenus]VCU08188.1 hypothetical protein RHODGE_RHODGE_02046 [Rhodoplanes serenus]